MKRSIFATSIFALTALVACDTASTETVAEGGSPVNFQRSWSTVEAAPSGTLGPITTPALADSTPVEATVPGDVQIEADVEGTAALATPPVEGVEIEVWHGESLYTLAAHSGLTVEQLAGANGLDVTRPIQPGQVLIVPVEEERSESLSAAREAAADGRLERYVGRRGGLVGTSAYQVQTGDTAWGVAKQQAGVPMWVLSAYNEDIDLDRLRIGDELIVPVLADTIAQLDEPAPEIDVFDRATPGDEAEVSGAALAPSTGDEGAEANTEFGSL